MKPCEGFLIKLVLLGNRQKFWYCIITHDVAGVALVLLGGGLGYMSRSQVTYHAPLKVQQYCPDIWWAGCDDVFVFPSLY